MEGKKKTGWVPFAGGRAWLLGSGVCRYSRLAWSEARGWIEGMGRHGWWPLLWTVMGAMALLAGVPLVLNAFGSGHAVGDWLSITNVILLLTGFWFVRWLFRARERVVVDSFVDYTMDDKKAVEGLSTLLVAELVRLQELYQQIDDLSVPTAVGVERHGGFGRGKEAGVFLTVSADSQTNLLEGAIASDATIGVGPTKLPIGPIADILNRLARGPRVVGSVHLTDAAGGPTLTAQFLGKESSLTWRVDKGQPPESAEERKAFLDEMVRELACRMFTELTLHGSARWKAVEAFNEYLRLYGDSRRTPRDRTRFLKRAQAKLLEAVAEDERFDLAFYNLGVIYTQLADTERTAEQESEDATSIASFDRYELDTARRAAAQAIFERAAAKNPERWEAYYAQAVVRFSGIDPPVGIYTRLEADDERRAELGAVVALCTQALRVSPGQQANVGAVYDLLGMAQARLGNDYRAVMKNQRRAARHSWIEYCDARRRDRARPAGRRPLAEHARANATAAVHNLALAYERRALAGKEEDPTLRPRDYLDLYAAEAIFRRAERLADEGSPVIAACRFERAGALEWAKRFKQAAVQLQRAGRIHARNPEYRARRAKALALRSRQIRHRRPDDRRVLEVGEEARAVAGRALELLARPFSISVAPYATESLRLRCQATLDALEAAYLALGDQRAAKRMRGIVGLGKKIEKASTQHHPVSGRPQKRTDPDGIADGIADLREERAKRRKNARGHDWELEQLDLAIGRLNAEARNWKDALEEFTALVERLSGDRKTDRLVEYGAYAHLARAQREQGDPFAALGTAAEEVRRDSLRVEARREAGRAHFALGQFSDALDAWKHALWLSPCDPYLHYEVAMCHRRMAHQQPDPAVHDEMIKQARQEFEQAQELFDGEYLDGEAWTRLWLGKLAHEEGDLVTAVAQLQGAEHGSATAAACLLLGESHLLLEQRPAAAEAFKRCKKALTKHRKGKAPDEPKTSELRGRDTIDALWGDELPRAAVRARRERGEAEAKFISPGASQGSVELDKAKGLLESARAHAEKVRDPGAQDQAMIRVLDSMSFVLQKDGEVEKALELVRKRLRREATKAAEEREAELLERVNLLHRGNGRSAELRGRPLPL